MPLTNMNEMLVKAREGKYAIANFDVPDSVLLRGVMQAAAKMQAPVILAFAEPFFGVAPMPTFTPMLLAEAKEAAEPVCIHLDHARSLELIEQAIGLGFTSAMFDGSDLPFEENVQKTKEAVEICHRAGASCEAELGQVGGLDGYSYSGDPYTDVEKAKEFVSRTGIDALAVAIGTVHGVYKEAPKLNFERLQELKEAVDIPLVLHGGSGLSPEDFQRVIHDGISKINIFTELTQVAFARYQGAQNYLDAESAAIAAVQEAAQNKIALFMNKK